MTRGFSPNEIVITACANGFQVVMPEKWRSGNEFYDVDPAAIQMAKMQAEVMVREMKKDDVMDKLTHEGNQTELAYLSDFVNQGNKSVFVFKTMPEALKFIALHFNCNL